MAKKVGSLLVDVAMNVAKIDRDVQQVHRKFDKMGRDVNKSLAPISKAFTNIQSTMLKLGAAYGAVRMFRSMITDSIAYEKSLKSVESLLDRNLRPAMKGFERDVLKMSRAYGEGTAALTKGLYDIISASVSADQAMGVLEQSVIAAKAGLTDTAVAADAITTIMNAYGMEAKEASNISDTLFGTIKYGKTTFEELGPAMGKVVSIAATAKVSFEEVGAVLATLTAAGLNTDEAVTALKATILTFLKPQADSVKEAKNFGLELNADTLAAEGLIGSMKKLTGMLPEQAAKIFAETRALTGATSIMNNMEVASKFLANQLDNTGLAQDAFTVAAESSAFALDKFNASMTAFGTQAGTMFLPALTAATDGITSFLEEVEEGFKYVWEQMEELDKQRGLILRDQPTYGPRGVDAARYGPRGAAARQRRGEGEFIRITPAGDFPDAGTGDTEAAAKKAAREYEALLKRIVNSEKEAAEKITELTLGTYELKKQKLQEWLENAVVAAEAAGKPAQIYYDAYSLMLSELASEQMAAYEDMETAGELAMRDLQTLADGASDTISSSFANFASSAMLDFENIGESFAQMISSMLSDLARLSTQQLFTSLFTSILGSVGSGASGGTGTTTYGLPNIHTGGAVTGFARGGAVDDIPAMLQAGEFVVQRDAVKQMPIEFWDGLNQMHAGGAVQGFAMGGKAPKSGLAPNLLDTWRRLHPPSPPEPPPPMSPPPATTPTDVLGDILDFGEFGDILDLVFGDLGDVFGNFDFSELTRDAWIKFLGSVPPALLQYVGQLLKEWNLRPMEPQLPGPDWPENPLGPGEIPKDFLSWGDESFSQYLDPDTSGIQERFGYRPWAATLVRPPATPDLNRWRMPRLPKSVEKLFAQYGFETRKDMSYDPSMYQDYGGWADPLLALSIMTGMKMDKIADIVPIAELIQGSFDPALDFKESQAKAKSINDLLTGGTGTGLNGTDLMAETLSAMYFNLGTRGELGPERQDMKYDISPELFEREYAEFKKYGLDLAPFKDFHSISYLLELMTLMGDMIGETDKGIVEDYVGLLEQAYTRAYNDLTINSAFDYISPEGLDMLGQRPGWVDTGHPEDSIGNPANWLPTSILNYTGEKVSPNDPSWDTWGDYTQKHGFEQFNPLDQIEDWAPIVPRRTPPGNPRDAEEWARQLGLTEHTAGMWSEGGAVGLGLKSNEVPAILTRGELVLRPDQYHSGGIVGYAGGGPVMPSGLGGHQTTINIINKTPIQIEATEEFSMENFSQTIKNITIRAVQTDPSYRALMQGG